MKKNNRGVVKLNSVTSELDKAGGRDKVILKELVKLAKSEVRRVSAGDKLKAIELIARIKGWIKEGEVGIQQNILLNWLGDSKKLIEMKGEDEEVVKEISSDV
ncbi:MAG: hypothetical protein N2Z73_03640 [Endomicrobia bacterium]|nr:hypothetical protein [Endomicrobiia bacterium]